MKQWLRALGMAACALTSTVLADADCDDPVARWQPRDTLRHQLESKGWKVKRIRVHDGCYEVHGIDSDGNRVEAEFAPASLEIRELEIRYNHRRDQPRHRDARQSESRQSESNQSESNQSE